MPVRFSQAGRPDDLFRRIRERFSAGRYRRKVVSAVILPKLTSCFGGRLQMQLPADFRVRSYQKERAVFSGTKSGMTLTALRMRFSVPVFRLTAEELSAVMQKAGLRGVPELRRGFLRRAPTLTASLDDAVLHLIQVRGTLYLLLMTGITPENGAPVPPVLASVRIRPAQNAKED